MKPTEKNMETLNRKVVDLRQDMAAMRKEIRHLKDFLAAGPHGEVWKRWKQ